MDSVDIKNYLGQNKNIKRTFAPFVIYYLFFKNFKINFIHLVRNMSLLSTLRKKL